MMNEANETKSLETESDIINETQEKEPPDDNGSIAENSVRAAPQNGPRLQRKLFECDVCNMKFSNGANMRRHKMRHTGVKPYECRICQKRFFRKDHLAEHFSTHSKTLPFHCPICGRGFQRQIAMRAHFQNEHVGQHDLVKTCPLCSFRAHTMKALRVHFFNRHGVDLDSPGPAGAKLLAGTECNEVAQGSESGDSADDRSTDNATPPMHYLTPHVEISMADTAYDPGQSNNSPDIPPCIGNNVENPESPQSADSNNNAASNSINLVPHNNSDVITPSISLIPIKQEVSSEDTEKPQLGASSTSMEVIPMKSTMSQTVKVSPLKSLLREDLKRRISARVNWRALNQSSTVSDSGINNSSSSTITSTEHEAQEDSVSTHWMAQSNNVSALTCLFCNIGFPDQTLYFLHKGCHSESNPWKCNICGEQCNNVYEFNSHLLSKSHQ